MPKKSKSAQLFSLETALTESFSYAILRAPHIFKISWPVLAAMVALFAFQIAVYVVSPITPQELQRSSEAFWRHTERTILFVLAHSLVQLAFFIVIVRDYLLQERPVTLFPMFWDALVRTIVLILIVLVASMVIFLPTGFIGANAMQGGNTASYAVGISMFAIGLLGVFYFSSRWITWITSYAAGQPQTIGEAWEATGKASIKIFAGLLILTLVSFLWAIVLSAGMAFALFGLGQMPQPGGPIFTAGSALVTLIQFALGIILFAAYSVYAASVLRQTKA